MDRPVFPQGFVENHCSKVLEARSWRKHFNLPPDAEDDAAHAECAFLRAGAGMECETCDLFLTRPVRTEAEKIYLPLIEQYYKDVEKYDKAEAAREAAEKKMLLEVGSGI